MAICMTKDTSENSEDKLTDAREMLGLFEEYFPEDYSMVKYEFQKLHPDRFGDIGEEMDNLNLDEEIMELAWMEKFEEKQIP